MTLVEVRMRLEERLRAQDRTAGQIRAPDSLALLRLLVAELPRIGDLGAHADQMFWQAGAQRISSVIALASSGAVADAVAPARQFIEMLLLPILMRVLLGEAVAPLLDSAPARIAVAITVRNRNNILDGWK